MFKFRYDNSQELLNISIWRNRERLSGAVRVYILALVTVIILCMGTAVINAQELFVGNFGSDEVLRYDGETGDFIDKFVTAGSGGLDSPFFLIFFGLPPDGGGGGCSGLNRAPR